MKQAKRGVWLVGFGAVVLAALACTCGPLAQLTGQAEQAVEELATEAVGQAATVAVEVATQAPEVATQAPQRAGDLPVWDGGDGYETTLVQEIAIGGTGSGNLVSLSEAHNWLFRGQPGQTVTIRVTGQGETDVRMTLLDGEGDFISSADDVEGYNPVLVFTLQADDWYTARLDVFTEGNYTIALEEGDTLNQAGAPTGGEFSQWAINAWASSEYSNPSWAALQAIGEPDTFECGDINTAWASATSTGVDFLALEYATAVIPTVINIYETYNPDAVVRVDVTDPDGNTVTIYEADPVIEDTCPLVLSIAVSSIDYAVNGVTVYLDQTNHSGWNEIDAVELVGVMP